MSQSFLGDSVPKFKNFGHYETIMIDCDLRYCNCKSDAKMVGVL